MPPTWRRLRVPGLRPNSRAVEPIFGRRSRLGGVGEQHQARVGGQLHPLVGEFEMTHHLVVKVLHAGAVQGTRRAPDHRSAVGVLAVDPRSGTRGTPATAGSKRLRPYSPLGKGFLTGTVRSTDQFDAATSASNPRFTGENFQRNLAIADEVQAVAGDAGVTPAQVALGLVVGERYRHATPIPGHADGCPGCEENVAADDVVNQRRPDEAAGRRTPASGGHAHRCADGDDRALTVPRDDDAS